MGRIRQTSGVRAACGAAAAIAVLTSFLVSSAQAEDAAAAAPDAAASSAVAPARRAVIEEIIVTARRREESAQKVPIAITAITTELQNSNIRGIADLNGYAPNVRIDRDQGRQGLSVNIRGISPTRIDDNSLDAPVGVLIDGIYLGTLAGQAFENFDLERIEILRGPQGTLFGRNTVGGVLNVVRSRPTGEWGGKFQGTLGKDGQREFRILGNAPIIKDVLAAKVFFALQKYDGYLKNTTTGDKQPEKDYMNYGVTFLANPMDQFEAQLTVERFKDKSQGGAPTNYNIAAGLSPKPPAGSPLPDNSGGTLSCGLFNIPGLFPPGAGTPCRTSLKVPSSISADSPNDNLLDTKAYTLQMHYDVTDDIRLVSVTGYRDQTEDRFIDLDGSSSNLITINRDNTYDQFSQEFRVEGKWNNVTFVGGAYYFENKFTQDWITGGAFWETVSRLSGYSLQNNTWRPVPFLPGGPNITAAINAGLTPLQACRDKLLGAVRCDTTTNFASPLGTGYGANPIQRLFETQKTTATAYFASVDWEFLPKWTATAGIRYTDEKKEFKAGQSYIGSEAKQFQRNFPEYVNLKKDWQETSPKVGISYKLTDDILFYGSYSEGFHSGGFFGVNQNSKDFVRDQYDPEFAYSTEVGMKSQFLDNTLQVNATVFYNKFKDKQESSVQFDGSTNTVATVFSNVANALYKGAELEVQWVANDYIRVFGDYGYLNAKYDKFKTDLNPNDSCVGPECIVDASFLKPRNAPKKTWGVGGTINYPVGGGRLILNSKYSFIDKVETSLLNLPLGRLDSRKDLAATLTYAYKDYTVSVYGRNLTDETFEIPGFIATLFATGFVPPGRTWGVEFTAALSGR